jgi:hypothetical protein
VDTTDDAIQNTELRCRKIHNNRETAQKQAFLTQPILGGLFDVDY